MGICEKFDNFTPAKTRRRIGVIVGILDLFLFGGYHYGFNSLIGIYKSLGLFAYNCTQSGCMYDDNKFGIAFNVWLVTQMCLITLAGLFMDKVGLRALKLVATVMYAIGTIMFGFTTGSTQVLFYAGGILVALSSICTLICDHQISSMFPEKRGFCISLFSGAFDSSTVIAYAISVNHVHFSLQWSFVSLAIGALIFGTFIALFILTMKSVDMSKFARIKEKQSVLQSRESCLEESSTIDIYAEMSHVFDEEFSTLKKTASSASYILINFWFILGLFRFCVFLSQLHKQLTYLFPGDETLISHLLEVSSAFSMCGFFAAPLSGLIIDVFLRLSRDEVTNMLIRDRKSLTNQKIYYTYISGLIPALTLTAVFSLLLSIMMFIRDKNAIYVAFLCLVILRSLLFSSFVSYLLTCFPIRYFGTLNGISSTVAGLFSLLQHLLLHASGTVANFVSLAVSIGLFITPVILFKLKH
ncbi:unnamed protein product [Trichobilharzia szidati]|nr:unnamed protein product [Trichobilharzia szidati]